LRWRCSGCGMWAVRQHCLGWFAARAVWVVHSRAASKCPHVEAQVELMALPEDVPDEQPVVCGSKSGTFLTRTQRVVLDGVEMSASRFEQVR
jgi:hypothetical protein